MFGKNIFEKKCSKKMFEKKIFGKINMHPASK